MLPRRDNLQNGSGSDYLYEIIRFENKSAQVQFSSELPSPLTFSLISASVQCFCNSNIYSWKRRRNEKKKRIGNFDQFYPLLRIFVIFLMRLENWTYVYFGQNSVHFLPNTDCIEAPFSPWFFHHMQNDWAWMVSKLKFVPLQCGLYW